MGRIRAGRVFSGREGLPKYSSLGPRFPPIKVRLHIRIRHPAATCARALDSPRGHDPHTFLGEGVSLGPEQPFRSMVTSRSSSGLRLLHCSISLF